jgi:hypothetical protein
MADETPDVSEILTRLGRVERENRRLKQLGLGVLVLAGAVLLMALTRPNRTLEAQKFVLKDANGGIRATLEMELGDRPTLSLRDAKGLPLVSLGGGDNPSLALTGTTGEQVELAASNAFYGLVLYGADRSGPFRGARGGLVVNKEIGPALALYDEKGNERVALEVLPFGTMESKLERGAEFGESRLVLRDPNGTQEILLSVHGLHWLRPRSE